MYVSKKHHIGKRAGLKNRGYFDLEDDYENLEQFLVRNEESQDVPVLKNKVPHKGMKYEIS